MAKRNYNLKIEANVSTAKVDAAMKSLQNKYEKITIGKGITKNLNEASKATKTLGQDFLDTSKKVAKFGAITAVLSAFTGVMYKAVDSILEMDKAMTEFGKVSTLTGDELKSFQDKAFEIGKVVKKTGSDVIAAATEFKKANDQLTDEQTLKLAETALLYTNISDASISAADSASFIISQMKAFNITAEDSMGIIDAVNEVANRMSVGSNDLQLALSKTSASMSTLGNSMEETIGLVTAGGELLTKQSSQTARGLRTIGINLAKAATTTGILETGFNGVTVALKNQNGEMKSTFEIMRDLAPTWNQMTNEQKTSLAQAVAGKQRFDVFTAVMNNFDAAVKANNIALNSSGSAMRENEKYAESLQAKINDLNSQFQKWANGGAGVVGVALDLANGFIQINDSIDIMSPLLVVAAAQFSGFSKAVVAGLTKMGVAATVSTGGLNLVIGTVVALLANIPKIYDWVTTTQDEQVEKLANIEQRYKAIEDSIKTEKDEQRLKILQAQLEVLKSQKDIETQKTAEGAVFGKGVVGKGLSGEADKIISSKSKFASQQGFDQAMKSYIDLQQQLKTTTDVTAMANIGDQMDAYRQRIVELSSSLPPIINEIESNMDNLSDTDKQNAQAVLDNIQAYLDWADALGIFNEVQNISSDDALDLLGSTEDQKKAIEELNNALDNVQSAYNTAQSALDEYAETGFISIDTYQSLLSLSPEYLSMLIDESGQLNLNADNVNNLTAAMIDEIGAKQAMMLINTAGTSEAESEALMNVSDAASAAGQSLWDFVTAQAADKIVKGEATDALMSQVNAIKSWADAAKKGIGSSANYTGSKGVAQANKDATAAIRENIKALEKQKSAYETAFKFMQDKIQTEIDKLEEQKSIEEEFWDAKINALKEQNEAIEDQIELQQLQANLAKAKSKKVYRLQGGQFGYFEDTEAVSQAQAALDEYNRKKAYEDEIKRLEDQKKATIDSIETQIKYWEKYKNEWASIADTVEKEQDRMTAEMILGTNLEGENWKTRLTAASGYLDGYRSVVNQLVAENDRLNASNQSVSSGGGAGSSAGTGQKFKVVAGTSQGSKTLKDGFTSKSDAQAYLNSLDPRAKQFASVVAYAKGTMFAPFSSLANVDENGSELKVPRGRLEEVRYGDQIVPAQQSKNLMEMSKYTPESFLNKAIARIGDTGQTVNNYIDTLKLEGINDVNDFVNALKSLPTLAMQSGSVRA